MTSPTWRVVSLFRGGGRYVLVYVVQVGDDGVRGRWRLQRQQDDEPRIARHRFHSDVTAMLLHDDVEGQIQPEAGAFPERLGGEERLEDVLADIFGDPGPIVTDLDAGHALAFPAGADGQRATLIAHRGDRVVDDVGPYLIEIAWIARDFRKRLVELLDHGDRSGVLACVLAQPVGEDRQRAA